MVATQHGDGTIEASHNSPNEVIPDEACAFCRLSIREEDVSAVVFAHSREHPVDFVPDRADDDRFDAERRAHLPSNTDGEPSSLRFCLIERVSAASGVQTGLVAASELARRHDTQQNESAAGVSGIRAGFTDEPSVYLGPCEVHQHVSWLAIVIGVGERCGSDCGY